MSGFFSKVQGFFKETYSGRYVAYLMEELFVQSPESFCRILEYSGIRYTQQKGNKVVAKVAFSGSITDPLCRYCSLEFQRRASRPCGD